MQSCANKAVAIFIQGAMTARHDARGRYCFLRLYIITFAIVWTWIQTVRERPLHE